MTTTFRAADAPATSRNEYWNHVAMTAANVMDLRVTSEVDVRDQLLVGELGAPFASARCLVTRRAAPGAPPN